MLQAERSGIERLLRPLDGAAVDAARGAGPPVWLTAGDWRLLASPRAASPPDGEVIERFTADDGATFEAVRRTDGTVVVPFGLDDAYDRYVSESWRAGTRVRKLSERQLQLYYRVKRLLPRGAWLAARRAFTARVKPPAFPRWPLEDGVTTLVRFSALCHLLAAGAEEAPFAWFWPGRHRAALILTHDVESAEGLRLALDLAALEESRGLRSSFNIVGHQYPVDTGIVRELAGRGFEIGLHGLHHDRSLFSSRAEFERQLPGLAEAAQRLGAVGFRSPATYRVWEWLDELPVDYDCTIPHSDPYEPQPGGCCSVWPFMLGRLVELPYTLPQDHTLFTLLRRRSAAPWLEQAAAIEERHGLIQCLSHPDPGYLGDADKRALYAEFLDAVAEWPGLWKALPREVASWWRRRDAGQTEFPEQQLGTMRRRSGPGYADLEPPAEA
jgi:peptidoglycan/xylan/chitin deacetylase (PgdA/CDA1 family)